MTAPFQIAALFVMPKGAYVGHPRIDAWPESRDARKYAGPWPIVAHPPCERFGRYAGPLLGQDDGCFEAALASVRKYGGVIEHPEGSHAWRIYGLRKPPRKGGWVPADDRGGWTCCVAQGNYGHRARKLTWLYVNRVVLPELRWDACVKRVPGADDPSLTIEQRRRLIKTGVCQRLSKNQRAATPIEFRNLLLSIAGSAMWVNA